MADKRKTKKKGQDLPVEKVEEKPSKLEYSVANHLRKYVPTKKTKFLNHQVEYFTANKAVDLLMDSAWASGSDVIFTTRDSVATFLDRLLKLKFFHRARKIPVQDRDYKPKELKRRKEKEREEKRKKELEEKKKKKLEEKKKKEKEQKKQETGEDDDEEAVEKEEQDGEKKEEAVTTEGEKEKEKDGDKKDEKDKQEEKKKRKAKIKLDMHLEQVFVDGSDAYVWMYDPVPFWYWIAGAMLVFGAIAVCLFPLWPSSVRKGVYYLSVAAAGFLVFILALAVLRFIVFCLVWGITFGRHHLWLLPNLTEEVGFFESFWPLYHYEYKDGSKKKKKKKKASTEEEPEEDQDAAPDTDKPDTDADNRVPGETTAQSETDRSDKSDSENSNSQAFEMVEKSDLEENKKENAESGEEEEEEEENENLNQEEESDN